MLKWLLIYSLLQSACFISIDNESTESGRLYGDAGQKVVYNRT